MKKFLYIFSGLLIITILALYFVSSIAMRIFKILGMLLIARLDLTLPLIFGSLFSPIAAIDVILVNFIILEPFISVTDIFALSIITFSVISVILVTFFYKNLTLSKKVKSLEQKESRNNFLCLS